MPLVLEIGVIVPAYRRPASLGNCLEGLMRQEHRASEIVVVCRPDDHETLAVATRPEFAAVVAKVETPGLVAALNAGIAASTTGLVAFVDDDAVPHVDWLARITAVFASDPRVAAVGGRDIVHHGDRVDTVPDRWIDRVRGRSTDRRVGQLQWWGRMTSNHHVGTGTLRDAHVVKGANMAFRAEPLRAHMFDGRLRGVGSQVHNEATVTLPLLREGWRVVYDPRIAVDHFPAERPAGDRRGAVDTNAITDAAHNGLLPILEHVRWSRRMIVLAWAFAVGTKSSPGLVNGLRLVVAREPDVRSRVGAAWRGHRLAWRAAVHADRPSTVHSGARRSSGR